jgi:aminoglycoside 2'-N-acetyltransferase I
MSGVRNPHRPQVLNEYFKETMTLTILQVDEDFVTDNLSAIRNLLSDAYEGDFSEEDWLHSFGGVRFLGTLNNEIVAHGSVVPREVLINEKMTTVGYLEAIAVSSKYQGQGIGSQLLSSMSEFCTSRYQISMLSTDEFNFYSNFGWKQFKGKSGVLLDGEVVPTPDEDDGLMYLIGNAGFSQEIFAAYCDPRKGDHW